MQVKEIIGEQGADVITVRVEDTVETVAKILAFYNIGCVPVRDCDGNLAGVLSERDLARSFIRSGERLRNLRAKDLMTNKVITCALDEEVSAAKDKMSRHHIRHLPVLENARLVGMISVRDVMQSEISKVTMERNVLRDIALVAR